MEHDAGLFLAVNINDAASRQTFLGIPDIPDMDSANTLPYQPCQGLGQSVVLRILTLQSLNKIIEDWSGSDSF